MHMWTFNHEDYSVPTNYNHGQRDSHCGYRSNFVLPRHSDRSANNASPAPAVSKGFSAELNGVKYINKVSSLT